MSTEMTYTSWNASISKWVGKWRQWDFMNILFLLKWKVILLFRQLFKHLIGSNVATQCSICFLFPRRLLKIGREKTFPTLSLKLVAQTCWLEIWYERPRIYRIWWSTSIWLNDSRDFKFWIQLFQNFNNFARKKSWLGIRVSNFQRRAPLAGTFKSCHTIECQPGTFH